MSTNIGRGCGWFLRPAASPKNTSLLVYRILFDPQHAAAPGTDVYLTSTNGTAWGLEGYIRLRGGYPTEFQGWDRDFMADGKRIGRRLDSLADVGRYFREASVGDFRLASLYVCNQTTRIGDQWLNEVFVWNGEQWGRFHHEFSLDRKAGDDERIWGPIVEFMTPRSDGIGVAGFDEIKWIADGTRIEFSDESVGWSWHDIGLSLLNKSSDGSFLVKG